MKLRFTELDGTGRANDTRGYRRNWEGTLVGCLVLSALGGLVLAPFVGRSAAPGLLIGPFTNYGGTNYISLLITNATATNIYEIHTRPDLTLPWVSNISGAYGQSNFLIAIGPESAMFFRALDCVNCDNDQYLGWQDADDSNTNVGLLTITIVSPTNGATIY